MASLEWDFQRGLKGRWRAANCWKEEAVAICEMKRPDSSSAAGGGHCFKLLNHLCDSVLIPFLIIFFSATMVALGFKNVSAVFTVLHAYFSYSKLC